MFTVGPKHARDHDPRCSLSGVRNRPQGIMEKGLIVYQFRNVIGSRGHTPLGTPEGPQVETIFLVAQHT